jgi:predicted ATP-dependent serine protease
VKWLKRILVALAMLPVAAGAMLLGLVGPYVLDDQRLDAAVAAVALDWRDFGLEKARTRLQYELDHQRIGLQVSDDSCQMAEEGGTRIVHCAWDVDVAVPVVGSVIPMAFESHAEIAADGDLR